MIQRWLSRQSYLDTLGGLFSIGCAIHCLCMPLLIVAWPMIGDTIVADSLFHKLMLFVVIPVALFSLIMGWRHHGNNGILVIGGFGLGLLTLLTLLESDQCSHCTADLSFWQWSLYDQLNKVGLILGSLLLCFAHWKNYHACKAQCQSD
jgi:hypothetical protein